MKLIKMVCKIETQFSTIFSFYNAIFFCFTTCFLFLSTYS